MNVTITPTKLKGSITPPPSKSQAHRLIIAAALGAGESVISNVAFSQDIRATLSCMEQLGARWEKTEDSAIRVQGIGGADPHSFTAGELPCFDCGESGSTLRFLIPIALAVAGGGVFTGHGRLMERPQKPYFDLFDEKGIFHEQNNGVLTLRGRLTPGEYALPGDVSSQFFTGLLYALPLLDGPSVIVSTTALESVGYINMTRQAMEQFGVTSRWQGREFHVSGGQTYRPARAAVESDWSQAGFWYAARGIGNQVEVTGMNEKSIQGDRVILDWGRMLRNEPMTGGVTVPVWREVPEGENPTEPEAAEPKGGCSVSLDVSHSPDLVPPLAAWGALMNGALYIENAGRLRIKESDRLATVTEVLNALGAEVHEEADRLIILGKPVLKGGVTVSAHNDHRIAMMAAVAATCCEQPVTITGAECVAKSYPDFWEDYEMLGGQIARSEV